MSCIILPVRDTTLHHECHWSTSNRNHRLGPWNRITDAWYPRFSRQPSHSGYCQYRPCNTSLLPRLEVFFIFNSDDNTWYQQAPTNIPPLTFNTHCNPNSNSNFNSIAYRVRHVFHRSKSLEVASIALPRCSASNMSPLPSCMRMGMDGTRSSTISAVTMWACSLHLEEYEDEWRATDMPR